jgi:ATP-dependent DNA helicase RecQ
LFQELRALRKSRSDALGVPPYVVFSDVTLRHLARSYPQSDVDFLGVPGVGEKKLKDFGTDFMHAIGGWLAVHERLAFAPMATAPVAARPSKPDTAPNMTALESLRLFRSGRSVAEIAAVRALSPSTIENHLVSAVEGGANLDPRAFFSEDEEVAMRAAFAGHQGAALSPVFTALDGRISYGQLRMFLAFERRAGGAVANG